MISEIASQVRALAVVEGHVGQQERNLLAGQRTDDFDLKVSGQMAKNIGAKGRICMPDYCPSFIA